MIKKQITLADLSRMLSLSPATVSRALKNYPDISQETKKRVHALAKELNYRPNSIAVGLRKRESKMIGVIIPQIVNHYFSAIIKGIMEVAYEADYRVMLCQSDESYEKEIKDAAALLDSRVDGLLVSIAHSTDRFEHFQAFLDAGVPVVMFDKVTDQLAGCSRIIVDDRGGAIASVKHLHSQGCRDIAHLAGPQLAYTAYEREMGYLDALRDLGLPQDPGRVYRCMNVTYDEGYHFTREMLKSAKPPDGIFAITDEVAHGAMKAIKEAGKRIPEDIALVGFSNWFVDEMVEPHLSSVSQPGEEMGRMAASILLQEIHSIQNDITPTPQVQLLKTELIIRQSSVKQVL